MYIENIIVGKLECEEAVLFGLDKKDWEENEFPKTLRTASRYLPEILVQAGVASSKNEIRRNRPDLNIVLDKVDFKEIKIGKRKLYIAVGN